MKVGFCEQRKSWGGEGTRRTGTGLPICNLPHSGSYRVRSGWRDRGLGSLPGGPGEPLQVSSVEGPGFHKPEGSEPRRRGSEYGENSRRTKYLNLVLSYPHEVKIGVLVPHVNLSSHCSSCGKALWHQSDMTIPSGKAANLPWRGYGTAPLATLLALPVDRMAGSDHLPQRPKHTVAADFKEAACS